MYLYIGIYCTKMLKGHLRCKFTCVPYRCVCLLGPSEDIWTAFWFLTESDMFSEQACVFCVVCVCLCYTIWCCIIMWFYPFNVFFSHCTSPRECRLGVYSAPSPLVSILSPQCASSVSFSHSTFTCDTTHNTLHFFKNKGPRGWQSRQSSW